jgi:tyrosyl-tRNA synthetase
MLLPILPGLDGVQKMSKSLGNTVGLGEDPLSMYSKLEKVPDAVVDNYLNLLTDLDLEALSEIPRERQKAMALEITCQRHGAAAARQAQADAGMLVGGLAGAGAAGAEVPEASLATVNFPAKAFYLIGTVGIGVTSSQAKRMIQDGGVRLDGEKLTDPNQVFATAEELEGKVLQLGKKTFRRLVRGTSAPATSP